MLGVIGLLLLSPLLLWLLRRRKNRASRDPKAAATTRTFPEQPITPVEEPAYETVPYDPVVEEDFNERVIFEDDVVFPAIETEDVAHEFFSDVNDEIIEEAGEIESNFVPDDPNGL